MIAEDTILGSILKEPYLLKDTDIQADHLTIQQNKKILTAMRKLDDEGKSIDIVSILTTGDPNSYGGAANLTRIQAMSNPSKFDDHVEIVMDQWREREKVNILQIAGSEGWSIDKITSELGKLTNDKTTDHSSITALLAGVFEAPWDKQHKKEGSPSGLAAIDNVTGGWQDSDLIILAARPSMGKTDVMLNFAKHAGWNGRLPIIFSLEMPGVRLRDRLLASTGRINRNKFKDLERFLSANEKKEWTKTLANVDKTNIQTFDDSQQTLSDIRMKVRKTMNDNKGLKPVIFIDYLTLIKPADWSDGNTHIQVSQISKGLKGIAKEFECPVICLAQLSRAVEKREDKRPMLSDLRESGSIEEDADIVAFLYRDSYYSQNENDRSIEIILAKHRNGETGKIEATYDRYTGELLP